MVQTCQIDRPDKILNHYLIYDYHPNGGQSVLQYTCIFSSKACRSTMSHNVYRVAFLGTPRDHHVIFVETKVDGSGVIFQVRGDIQNRMTYEFKDGKKPEDSASLVSKTPIGKVSLISGRPPHRPHLQAYSPATKTIQRPQADQSKYTPAALSRVDPRSCPSFAERRNSQVKHRD